MHLTRLQRATALALLVSLAPSARADDKQVCVRAVERAQVQRLDGKLREAHDGFVTCARAVCPEAIRDDCTRWIAEVEASLPTVVIDAVWTDGRDAAGLSVILDGQPLPEAAVGRAVALDPGEHAFRFEVPGAAPVEARTVIREGEKNRVVRVTFTALAPVPPATRPPVLPRGLPPAPGEARTRRPVPTSAFVVGGFALAGFGGFAYTGGSGLGQLDHLRSTCAPSCDPSLVESARREILVGDILGLAALVAAGVATWLVVTRPALTLGDDGR